MPPQVSSSPRASESRRAAESLRDSQAAAHAGFVLTGIVNTLLGPILPIVSRAWLLTDAQAGRLFAAQFLGAILGTLASGRLMAALGIRRCAMLGLALMAVGVTATGFSDARFGALAVVCFGLGLGVGVPATNLWIALANPAKSAAALNLLNASWCIGAASCAPMVLFFAERIGLARTLPAVGILLALTAILGSIGAGRGALLSPSLAAEAPPVPSTPSPEPLSSAPIAHVPLLAAAAHLSFIVLISAFLFFYVGVETGVGGWAATYAKRLNILSAAKIGFAQSIFYGALLVGRLLATLALRRFSPLRLLTAGMLIGAAGTLLFIIAPGPPLVLAGICIAGIGMAPMFPVVVSIYSNELGAATTRSAGVVFAIANLGGVTFPWLIGEISTRMHGLRYGMLVPFACIATMFVLATRLKVLLSKI